jgi:hypothetical protein
MGTLMDAVPTPYTPSEGMSAFYRFGLIVIIVALAHYISNLNSEMLDAPTS